ncbi:CHAT domain-containing protein [Corynebacterium epidermidicanis]|uniref:CHAT domain n=1 Tax=Corynebacterium epidermidicanis TaxID=1050174 RepID=A0A0G3GT74_9CORY|nr:CHAT domain-containing protein [Corynebacterium epidermidicanis]AKK03740.1 CHAT domain [Corynebacterium epidermidicanis]
MHTEQIIDKLLETANQRVEDFEKIDWNDELIWATGQNLSSTIKRATRQDTIDFEAALKIASNISKFKTLAKLANEPRALLEAQDYIGQIFRSLTVPNRDIARRRAAQILESNCADLQKLGDLQSAAISMSNAAVCLLEIEHPTLGELKHSLKLMRKSTKLRKPGSIDHGISKINEALSQIKIAKIDHPNSKKFEQCLGILESGRQILSQNKKFELKESQAYLSIKVEIYEGWLAYELRKADYELTLKAALEIESLKNINPDAIINYTHAIKANPLIFNLEETPSWIPTHQEILEIALLRTKGLQKFLQSIESEDLRHFTSQNILQIKHLRHLCGLLTSLDSETICALETLWNNSEYYRYFLHCSRLLIHTQISYGSFDQHAKMLLVNMYQTLIVLRDEWTDFDISNISKSEPSTFRFLACKLARFNCAKEAFYTLELSRGLKSKHTNSQDIFKANQAIGSSQLAVHITHDPTGTVVLVHQKDAFSAHHFPNLSGYQLTGMLYEPHLENAVHPVWLSKRSGFVPAMKDFLRHLSPVAEAISSYAAISLYICPGGYYSALPIWNLLHLSNASLAGRKNIYILPAFWLSGPKSSSQGEINPKIDILEAYEVPGASTLDFAKQEVHSIQKIVSSEFQYSLHPATLEDLRHSVSNSSIVLFSGHSVAHIYGADSKLVTYGTHITANDILQESITSPLVILNSCESGRFLFMQYPDEMLSLQSAFIYSGARFVIGTGWPIRDNTGFCFSVKFFETLRDSMEKEKGLEFDAIPEVFHKTIEWLKNATEFEVLHLYSNYAPSAGHSIKNGVIVSPFFSFEDWGAFYLMGR